MPALPQASRPLPLRLTPADRESWQSGSVFNTNISAFWARAFIRSVIMCGLTRYFNNWFGVEGTGSFGFGSGGTAPSLDAKSFFLGGGPHFPSQQQPVRAVGSYPFGMGSLPLYSNGRAGKQLRRGDSWAAGESITSSVAGACMASSGRFHRIARPKRELRRTIRWDGVDLQLLARPAFDIFGRLFGEEVSPDAGYFVLGWKIESGKSSRGLVAPASRRRFLRSIG